MRKLVIALLCMASAGVINAEDVLQVIPFETKAGATTDDALCFSVSMNNASAEIWALQFDMKLPEGMTLDDVSGYDPFNLSADRFPHTTGRDGAITWKHSVYYDVLQNGWYRIVVFTSEVDRIMGQSGELFKVYYLTDDTMQPGLHPIHVKGTVLTIDGSTDIQLGESTSYCLIGESPLKSADEINLEDFIGYIPSWVVTSLNEDLKANAATSVRMEQTDSIGAIIETHNKNALYYVKASSKCAEQLPGKNVITTIGDNYHCDNLYLYDGEYDFNTTNSLIGNKAYFDRTFTKDKWYTVCLPFAVSSEQVSILKESGVTIAVISQYEAPDILFSEVNEMTANTPYLVKCDSDMQPFNELSITEISASNTANEIVKENITMKGCYETTYLYPDEDATFYVFNEQNSEYVKVDMSGKVLPFCAYVQLYSEGTPPRTIPVLVNNNDDTSIETAEVPKNKVVEAYTIEGKHIPSIQSRDGLGKGIYIIDSRKVLIK